MMRKAALNKGIEIRAFPDQVTIDIVAQFVTQRCGNHCPGMGSIEKNEEFRFLPDLRPAEKAPQGQTRATPVGFRPHHDFRGPKTSSMWRSKSPSSQSPEK